MSRRPWVIVGAGYVGGRLARQLVVEGEQVWVCRRSLSGAEVLRAEVGAAGAFAVDLDQGAIVDGPWPDGAVFVALVPPSSSEQREKSLLAITRAGSAIIYVSSTGVYGQGSADGGWMDERAPTQPLGASGVARLRAERALQGGIQPQQRLVILRPAGIYGPGRDPATRLRAGQLRVIEGPPSMVSRIHVDDLVAAIIAAGRGGRGGAIYNVADDEPSTTAEVGDAVAVRLGLPPPPRVSAQEVSDEARAMLTANRRIDASAIRRDLSLTWRVPTWRQWLLTLIAFACQLGCSPRPVVVDPGASADGHSSPTTTRRAYRLMRSASLNQEASPIGYAIEERQRSDRGFRLVRREHLRVRRGAGVVDTHTHIAIEAGPDLTARRVTVDLADAGRRWHGEANREADGRWRATWGSADGQAHQAHQALLDGAAVPSELVPDLMARDGEFRGMVLLAADQFAVAEGRARRHGSTVTAQLMLAGPPPVEEVTTIEVDATGLPTRITAADGLSAVLVDEATATAPFAPVDILAQSALALPAEGTPYTLVVNGRVVPATPSAARSGLPNDIRRLVADIHQQLVADLLVPTWEPGASFDRGDCTAFALTFAKRAATLGISSRVVTGWVEENGFLWRHRWNQVHIDGTWVDIDASLGQASAQRPLYPFRTHGADSQSLLATAAALAASTPRIIAIGR